MMSELSPELRIVEYQNEWIVRSRYLFAYEHGDTSGLAVLREQYRLDEVIAAGSTEWEQLLLLRDWVHRRWDHGWSVADGDDALDILAKADQGHDFSCGYYATTLVQCAIAVGFQARRVLISKTNTSWMSADEGNVGHVVVEVWSQDWHKWAILDPDLNAHYEHRGVPLSALEIHRLWKDGRWREAQLIQGPTPFRVTAKAHSAGQWSQETVQDVFADFTRYQATDYYSILHWEMRNNHLSSREEQSGVYWFDHTESPQLVHANRAILTDDWTCNESDAYWTLNQAQISLRLTSDDLEQPVVRVEIEHSMPNLDRILVKQSDDGPWGSYQDPYLWPLQVGKNVIEAKPLSLFGSEGYTSRVVLRFLGAG